MIWSQTEWGFGRFSLTGLHGYFRFWMEDLYCRVRGEGVQMGSNAFDEWDPLSTGSSKFILTPIKPQRTQRPPRKREAEYIVLLAPVAFKQLLWTHPLTPSLFYEKRGGKGVQQVKCPCGRNFAGREYPFFQYFEKMGSVHTITRRRELNWIGKIHFDIQKERNALKQR